MKHLEFKAVNLEIGGKLICSDLNLTISDNQRWGLLGKNGVGKTTLLHSIIGLRPITSGEIHINGQPFDTVSRIDMAKMVGVLFQHGINDLPSTVLETVLLGRHPHVQSLLRDSPDDLKIAHAALQELKLDDLSNRQVDTLSGGEKQRLALAMLIAQTPDLFLLDEPSNHLDVAFQMELLSILTDKVQQNSASLLMATHDINLAARFCDNIILLMGDGNFVSGSCKEVLTEPNLTNAYGCEIRSIHDQDRVFFFPK